MDLVTTAGRISQGALAVKPLTEEHPYRQVVHVRDAGLLPGQRLLQCTLGFSLGDEPATSDLAALPVSAPAREQVEGPGSPALVLEVLSVGTLRAGGFVPLEDATPPHYRLRRVPPVPGV